MNEADKNSAVAAGQLRSFIERIERLEEEKKTISDDIKEVYAELKGSGFDSKAVREVIRLRKKEDHERQEEEAMVQLYKNALGMR
ncbi:DUF2312 domain-containing protein [Bartonella apis]|uniref:DUF2312 domain-containing protein n=1 Tax=Bartonella apis TaxID=1686310 RepID=UPI00242BAA91|nr:DUF2312 domain-containing protein [Bartonella apis]